MDESYKTEWLKRLRSDDYAQGKGRLCTIDPETGEKSFCCLGVLSEIAVERGEAAVRIEENMVFYSFADDTYDGNPDWLVGTLGSNFGSRIGVHGGERSRLIDMNDGDNGRQPTSTFAEIAAWIEENL